MNFLETIELRHADSAMAGKQMHDALISNKVVKLTPGWHIPDLRAFYDTATEFIGNCINIGEDFTAGGTQTGEKWLEIRYDHDIPDIAAYRHSKNAQPLHTDESYITNPADIMFFYCVNKAEKGGATTFVDGPVLIDYLRKQDNGLYEDLVSNEVCYRKADEFRKLPIIYFDAQGIPKFNYNYYCIDRNETDFNKDLNKRFFDFLQDQVAFSYMIQAVSLAPGESVAWWDEYVLHGRTSFSADKTNDRFIWKTGLKWID